MNFTKLGEFLSAQHEMGIPGCEIAVSYRGERVFRRCYGFDDEKMKHKTSEQTVYQLFSMTKLVTTGAAMQLIERGLLGLDDPVAKWLPAYGQLTVMTQNGALPAKNTLSVRHLMAMQGGFDYDLRSEVIINAIENGHVTTRGIVDALAKKPLCFEPGTHFQYSLCHDILGAVVEAVSGRRLADYIRENIFDPLGVRDAAFHANEVPNPENIAQMWIYNGDSHSATPTGNDNPFIFTDRYDSGGAGLHATTDAYMAYAETIANGGLAKDGKTRLFRPETIDLWHEDQQTSPDCYADFQKCKPGYGYGLGVRTNITPGTASPLGEFGWDGAAGAYVLLDTVNRLAVVYTQSVLGCGYAPDTIHPAIRSLTYEALGL